MQETQAVGMWYMISSRFEAASYCRWSGESPPIEAQCERAARGWKGIRIFPSRNEIRLTLINILDTYYPLPDAVPVDTKESNKSPRPCADSGQHR